MAVPPKLVNQIVSTLDSSKPVNQKVDEVIALLQSSGFAHHQDLLPKEVLCHPSNRAPSMLSYHDVHAKGAHLMEVGVKKSMLQGAICIEMSTQEPKRPQQIAKNKQLIAESQGCLAPLCGSERSLATIEYLGHNTIEYILGPESPVAVYAWCYRGTVIMSKYIAN